MVSNLLNFIRRK